LKIELTESDEMKIFSSIWKLVASVVEEVPLQVTKDGLLIQAMDPSHVAMLDMTIKSSSFTGFEEIEANKTLCFDASEFKKRLDAINPEKEKVNILHDEEKAKIIFDIVNPETQRKRRLRLPLLDYGDEELPNPKINFHGKAKFPLADMNQALTDASMVSQHINVSMFKEGNEEKLTFEAIGDMGESFLEVNTFSSISINNEVEKATSVYTTSWLGSFIAGIKPLAKQINIELATDMPIKISINEKNIDCKLYLAPCIGV